MSDKCNVCQKPIGDRRQRFPLPERLMRGPKSGMLGWYPDPDYPNEEDVVHMPECCSSYWDMEQHPILFDEQARKFRDQLRPDIEAEVRDDYEAKITELEEQVARLKEGVPEDIREFCFECAAPLEEGDGQEPEEPQCLWCKASDQVWEKSYPAYGTVFNCRRCNRYWNEHEEELRAAS